MKAVLLGPHPLRPGTLQADARAALARATTAVWNLSADEIEREAETGEQPGLYLVTAVPEAGDGADQAQPRLVGFWLSFGPDYLHDGPLGPPDQAPPWVEPLLEALIEEVWWSNIPYFAARPREWRIPIVLEWIPSLALRAELAPPGDPRPAPTRAAPTPSSPSSPAPDLSRLAEVQVDDDGADAWLEEPSARLRRASTPKAAAARTTLPPAAAPTPTLPPTPEPPVVRLPARRSLLCLVEARLQVSARLHRASFQVVTPPSPSGAAPAPWPTWILEPLPGGPAGPTHRLGAPLSLPGERVGFPTTAWLTRQLNPWPRTPGEIVAGRLPDRVVQSRLRGQAAQASTLLLTVIAAVVGVTSALRLAAEPRPRPSEAPLPPAPQPSLSPCSPEHERFVEELRCQVATMASERGAPRATPACGDLGQDEKVARGDDAPDPNVDLQSSFCGLLDRARDGSSAQLRLGDAPADWGELAVAQACFNVLSHPYDYRLPASKQGSAPMAANTTRMLEDPALLIEPLPELMEQLRGACEAQRTRAERAVEGAIFATHIGAPGGEVSTSEGAKLRAALMKTAQRDMGEAEGACFARGAEAGLGAATLGRLCGEVDEEEPSSPIWTALGGQTRSSQSALQRYTAARFVPRRGSLALPRPAEPLWACHLGLADVIADDAVPSPDLPWELPFQRPTAYRGGQGAVQRQLDLDATLLAMDGGQPEGSCWAVVRQTLQGYAPVHPLLAEPEADGWPSAEQQLCGQICAAAFRIRDPDKDWITPQADLGVCLSTEPSVRCPPGEHRRDIACDSGNAPGAVPQTGEEAIDTLGLPWNGLEIDGWQRPSAASICAFHLIAQGYFPESEDGFVGSGMSPRQWAGETVQGGVIAGSPDGEGAKSAISFDAGLGARAQDSCGFIAAQCLSQAWLDVTADERLAPYQWVSAWANHVDQITRLPPVRPSPEDRGLYLQNDYPWCTQIRTELATVVRNSRAGTGTQGNTGCVEGVRTAYEHVTGAIRAVVNGETAEATP